MWSNLRKNTYTFFKEHLSRESGTLLDLGAGLQQFKELTSAFKTTAVDKDPYPGIDVIADITQPLPFPDESFSVALLSHTLEHVSEPYELLRECQRVLKPGGLLILAVPFMVLEHQGPYDFYRYTQHGLRHLLRDFDAIQVVQLGTSNDVLIHDLQKILMKGGIHRFVARPIVAVARFLPVVTDIKMSEGYGVVARKKIL
jgi:SAM-dependent methyltransferase